MRLLPSPRDKSPSRRKRTGCAPTAGAQADEKASLRRRKKKEVPGQSKSLDRTDAPAAATVAVEDLPTRVGGPCCRVIGMERWIDGAIEQ